jgi:hypothetical protein
MTLKWYGDQINEQIRTAAEIALLEAADDLKQESSDEAPIESGDLRGNAGVDDSTLDSGYVEVGYNLPYALRQHEDLNYSHPQGGKAKFLEDPFNRNVEKYKKHIANAVDEASK